MKNAHSENKGARTRHYSEKTAGDTHQLEITEGETYQDTENEIEKRTHLLDRTKYNQKGELSGHRNKGAGEGRGRVRSGVRTGQEMESKQATRSTHSLERAEIGTGQDKKERESERGALFKFPESARVEVSTPFLYILSIQRKKYGDGVNIGELRLGDHDAGSPGRSRGRRK